MAGAVPGRAAALALGGVACAALALYALRGPAPPGAGPEALSRAAPAPAARAAPGAAPLDLPPAPAAARAGAGGEPGAPAAAGRAAAGAAEPELGERLPWALTLDVRALTPDGAPLAPALAERLGLADLAGLLFAVATDAPPPARWRWPDLRDPLLERYGEPLGASPWTQDPFAPTHPGSRWILGGAPARGLPEAGFLGRLVVLLAPPGHVALYLNGARLAVEPLRADAREARFVVGLDVVAACIGGVRGRAVDPRGGPPVEGVLRVEGAGLRLAEVPLDALGAFAVDALPPGALELELRARGFGAWRSSLELEPGATLDLGELALAPEVALAARVLDAGGAPARARIEWARPADGALTLLGATALPRGFEGRFFVGGLEPGVYWVRAWPGDGAGELPRALASRWVPADARRGDALDLLLLAEPPVPVTLRAAAGAAGPLGYRLEERPGIAAAAGSLSPGGAAELGLAPGVYRLEVRAGGALLDVAEVVVREAPLELTLGG